MNRLSNQIKEFQLNFSDFNFYFTDISDLDIVKYSRVEEYKKKK